MTKLGEQAVVCGAGMGGLLAARVLSEFYGTVTVVERDNLPDAADQRRGVPQGRHFHVLWSRGADELARLFPGIHDDLIAGGAEVCDDGDLSRVSIRLAGHELSREGKFSDPSAVKLHLLSRPLLESHVRQRVGAIDNVEILDGHDFVEPIAPTPQRVTGANIVDRDSGAKRELNADLLVDAMGRSARTPAFLDDLGCGRPVAERSTTNANYTSLQMRIPEGIIKERMTFVVPEPKKPTGGAFSVYEHDTWIFTLTRLADNEPPNDLTGMIRMATQFAPPGLLRALKRGEPISEISVFRYPGAIWRRYDQMDRFPAGFLVFGDAICSTNPIYGQGMTVAALEATALRDCLTEGNGDLSRRFFAATAAHIGPMWASNQFNDLYMDNGDPDHAASKELLDFREAVLSAAESSPAVTEKLYRSMNLVDPPTDYSPLLT
ncbi:MAG TPA: 2-polyprenyl-6-methoxyphenol hydroxylase-like oxidoreductase [Mycobacterium sp.]|uniref:FAD-dependent oxidoreductase n=1 Tax=Mycobacterium sp. TaxID=1785 RepID=UPI002BED82A9|nr:2-polyprenyl-6-methoxyphenol hydroxylase-like oxidoreductase [Mycobacterium sp.]HXO83523.1 2-polyprenyl-6-methoxyphenol hydroxylase-like oxidoreductase [Mycobacterium sp.]